MGRVIQDDGWRISDRVGADVTAITAPAKTGSRRGSRVGKQLHRLPTIYSKADGQKNAAHSPNDERGMLPHCRDFALRQRNARVGHRSRA